MRKFMALHRTDIIARRNDLSVEVQTAYATTRARDSFVNCRVGTSMA
jgi:hypothetical protein